MARRHHSDQQEPVLLSLFDRLSNQLDPEMFRSRSASEDRLEQSVLEDLADLLNTRFREADMVSDFEEVATSIRAFGIPDFSDITINDEVGLGVLGDDIADAVRIFEPRLSKIAVSQVADPERPKEVYFRVSAMLNVLPYPKPVEFDYLLNADSKKLEAKRL